MAKLRKKKIPYTQVANAVLYDKTLSLKAKGLFAYLFSKPEGWNFSSRRMQEDHADKRESIMTGLQELEDRGYLQRKRRGDGKVDYYLEFAEYPKSENPTQDTPDPKSENPYVGKPLRGKTRPISNKEIQVTRKNTNKTEIATPSAVALFIWEEYLKRMHEHPKRHVQIVAFYFQEKKLAFDNLGQAQTAIRRHLRAAQALTPFSDTQLVAASKKASKDYPEWTLETLIKVLTR